MITLFFVVIWPLATFAIDRQKVPEQVAPLLAPQNHAGWTALEEEPWDWKPLMPGADDEFQHYYQKDGHVVYLFTGHYLSKRRVGKW